jgi:polyribonucleotide nucleotidyltransferase
VDGELVINPTHEQRDQGDIDLVVAGTDEAIVMVEAGAKEVAEADIIDALERKKFNLQHTEEKHDSFVKSSINVKNISSSVLDKVDLSVSLTREEYSTALKKYQKRIRELEHEHYPEHRHLRFFHASYAPKLQEH